MSAGQQQMKSALPDVDWEEDESRWAKLRAQYVAQTTAFDETESIIIAWAEIGYSHSGIAQCSTLDVTRSTVKSRMDEITQAEDVEAPLWTRQPDRLLIQSPVGIEETVYGGLSDE
jgi:hypothetical protein